MKKSTHLNEHESDIDEAIGKTGQSESLSREGEPSTISQDPIISEKDEVKQAEERLKKTQDTKK